VLMIFPANVPPPAAPLELVATASILKPFPFVAVMAPLLLMFPENRLKPTALMEMPPSAADIEAVLTMLPANVPPVRE